MCLRSNMSLGRWLTVLDLAAEPAAKKSKAANKKGKGKTTPRARKPKKLELFQAVPLDVLLLVGPFSLPPSIDRGRSTEQTRLAYRS